MEFNVKENSWVANLAAKKLGSSNIAIVIGNTVHLHNATKEEFLQNKKWVKHELCHIEQYKRYGTFAFIIKYVWESILHGYHDNKFEIEARQAEDG